MIKIGVLKESSSTEKRTALVPDVAQRLVKLGFEVCIESGAGESIHFPDAAFEKADAKIISDRRTLLKQINILLVVAPPAPEMIDDCPEGMILLGLLNPYENQDLKTKLEAKKITAFSLELLPRVTRAQSMDALSSQATVMGYKAVLLAGELSGRFFPMLTTAAGTIRPAKILVMGAGVAGLQAIATARRLGALVEAFDVRAASKEEVRSLGARFIEMPFSATADGGYARELTDDEKKQQQEIIKRHAAAADVIITTARIPGRRAPRLITEDMVKQMKPGSVIVDLAADSGGNCVLSKAGEIVEQNGVQIYGPINVPSMLPVHASEMYAKNLFNFLTLLTKDGSTTEPDFNDEILLGSAWTKHRGSL